MRATSLALALLLPIVSATPARAADNSLAWPVPWKAGSSLTYDKKTVTVKHVGAVEKIRNYADTTVITIVLAAPDGYLHRWTSRNASREGPGAMPDEIAVEREAVRRMSAIPLDVRLDGQGLFARIGNLANFQTVYRDIVQQGMERSIAQTTATRCEDRHDITAGGIDASDIRAIDPGMSAADPLFAAR